MLNVGVFCSASETIDEKYFIATRRFGEWMGSNKMTLVYGGANMGLMECIARAVKSKGGHVIGVAPAILEEHERVSAIPDEIIPTRNLSERKDIITGKSDILVALPGGLGTLDEVFHVMAAATIGYHTKKVVFYNVEGFYNELLTFLDCLDTTGFARREISNYYEVANTPEELKKIIENL